MKHWGTLRRFATGLFLLSGVVPALGQTSPHAELAAHCLLVPLPAAERARQAELVVEGEVLDARGFWDASHRRIYTAHRIRVFGAWKGQVPTELTLVTEGGRVELDAQLLTGTLRLQPGDQGVFFLRPAKFAGTAAVAGWTPYASEQGFIRYNLTDASATEPFRSYPLVEADFYAGLGSELGQPRREIQPNPALQQALLRRSQPVEAKGQAPVISSLSPVSVPAGVEVALTINGSGFGAERGGGWVEFANADDGGRTFVQAQTSDYVSWTDTQIRVRVPSYATNGNTAGTGRVRVTTGARVQTTSTATLQVPYAATNVQAQNTEVLVRPNHINQNGEGGYSFRFDPDFAAIVPATAAFQRALLIGWRCQTGVNWTIGANRTAAGIGNDGENAVGFDSNNEMPANVLGRTTSYYQGCLGANGTINFRVSEIDMQFDTQADANWQYGPGFPTALQFDFESVVLHELGHAQQLGHVISAAAVMYFGVERGRVNRTLSTNDRIGARTVLRTHSFPAAICGPSPMLPAPLTRVATNFVSGTGAEMTWTTRDECLVSSFIVERGADTTATAWQRVALVAAGSASTTYRVVDPAPLPGLSYYRLRVVRPNGEIDTVAPFLIQEGSGNSAVVQIYPNPVDGRQLRFLYAGSADGILSVYIYDAVGRACKRQGIDTRSGYTTQSLTVEDLRPGWYVLHWRDQAGRTGTVPFIKTN